MITRTPSLAALALALSAVASAAACAGVPMEEGTRAVQPGAPGAPTRPLTEAELAGVRGPGYTAADVAFFQGMIPHHGQALDMVALVPDRTTSEGIRLFARRIEVSQREEIALMQRWLEARGEAVPGAATGAVAGPSAPPDGGGGHAAHGIGMLTPDEMASLAEAEGPTFDRRFLELMIRHHEGALAMVETLFASPGGAHDGTVYALATEVDGGQRIEIERMRGMLATLR